MAINYLVFCITSGIQPCGKGISFSISASGPGRLWLLRVYRNVFTCLSCGNGWCLFVVKSWRCLVFVFAFALCLRGWGGQFGQAHLHGGRSRGRVQSCSRTTHLYGSQCSVLWPSRSRTGMCTHKCTPTHTHRHTHSVKPTLLHSNSVTVLDK